MDDPGYAYPYEREDDGKIEWHPRQVCIECGHEIVGDHQIEDQDFNWSIRGISHVV